MKYVMMSLLAFSLSLHAAEKPKKTQSSSASKKMSELGKIDQKTLDVESSRGKAEVAEETALYTEPDKIKLKFSCKAKDGHDIKQGEAGYDECLQKVKNNKPDSKDSDADIKVHLDN